ncbi:MAG: hypothetical protein RLZZ227_1407 [Pseudomonadota bacterium]
MKISGFPLALTEFVVPMSMRCRQLLLCALLMCGVQVVRAEEQTFGDYTIHYNAVNSTFLTPDIAAQYNIVRSERRAFLNIAVLRNEGDGSTTPVTAILSGGKRNLLRQEGAIEFNEIREGEAIYYIGEFDFSNAEILRFEIEVRPEGKGSAHTIEWSTQLYIN